MSDGNDRMPKIDSKKLSPTELEFMKAIERQNQARVAKLQRVRKNNLITAGIIGAGVLAIYGYSMYAVRQENFLDDFDEPLKTIETQKN